MNIINEIAQGLSSILKKNQKPVMQYAENIALVAEIPFDKTKVNQCQGFTYNPQTEKFIVACINADSTTQILYELNKDFTVARNVENAGADKLGHCNTLFFDGKLRATNGAANGNRIYTVGDDLTPGEYKDYTDNFYNVGYNPVTGQYVSILPGADNSTRKIRIYANSNLTDGKEYTVTVNEKNNDSNGALFIGNKIIFSLMRRIVEVEIDGDKATIVRELEFEPKAEIEDFALVNGAIYMAANSHDYIRIYKYDFARSYFNNINNDFLNNGIVVGNKVGYHGQSADGTVNYVIAKINGNNNLEVGDKRNTTVVSGKELKHYNGTDSYTVLTTNHYDKAIYNKVKTDELFAKKDMFELYRVNPVKIPFKIINDSFVKLTSKTDPDQLSYILVDPITGFGKIHLDFSVAAPQRQNTRVLSFADEQYPITGGIDKIMHVIQKTTNPQALPTIFIEPGSTEVRFENFLSTEKRTVIDFYGHFNISKLQDGAMRVMKPDMSEYVKKSDILAPNINSAPKFAGQMAIFNNTLYIAESTQGIGSWRMVALQPNDHL